MFGDVVYGNGWDEDEDGLDTESEASAGVGGQYGEEHLRNSDRVRDSVTYAFRMGSVKSIATKARLRGNSAPRGRSGMPGGANGNATASPFVSQSGFLANPPTTRLRASSLNELNRQHRSGSRRQHQEDKLGTVHEDNSTIDVGAQRRGQRRNSRGLAGTNADGSLKSKSKSDAILAGKKKTEFHWK